MSMQIYEEALADVRKVTEVAEDKAKRAVLEAVIPRIRNLIEQELLNENLDDENVLTDVLANPVEDFATMLSTSPDDEGKVTLDLDSLSDDCECDDTAEVDGPMFGKGNLPHEQELNFEGLSSTNTMTEYSTYKSEQDLELKMFRLGENLERFKKASRLIRETKAYSEQITQMILRVEGMYAYVQESVDDSKVKDNCESKLESLFRQLTTLQEQSMSKKKLIDLLREEDDSQVGDLDLGVAEEDADVGELTLKLTGLPADVELDDVGVDLVSGGDDDMSDESDMDLDADEDDVDLDVDLEDGDADMDDEGPQLEMSNMDDDTVVEIDESMLRREIKRMRQLTEMSDEKPGDANGHGMSSNVLDDFGNGEDDGDPFLDGEVTTADCEASVPAVAVESVKRRLAFEQRLRQRSKRRAASLKAEARVTKNKTQLATLKKEYALTARRFNESVARSQKYQKQLVESKGLRNEPRSNSVSSQLADKAANSLRKKLVAENLLNVKLTYANKVLQNESLTKREKARVIESLDEACTVREAKLVYESVVSNRASNNLKESSERTVMGSSSRATRPASTPTLNEGFETERWSRLAGITK